MKTPILLLAGALLMPLPLMADVEVTMAELQRIGFLPQDKADLKPEEKLDMRKRNPFAEKAKRAKPSEPAQTVETEESKLRAFFDKQKVSGVMKMGDKFQVAIGRLALEAGQTIPPVIPGQTQILRVIRVDEKILEIGWVEEAGLDTAVPRKILKRIDLKPVIEQVLVSDDGSGANPLTYLSDDKGKTVLPPAGIFPNPSSIADNLPPGSDTNPESVLTPQEQSDLGAAHSTAAIQPPPPAEPATPAPAPENPEDAVQPDPDLQTSPPAGEPAPAAPPSR